MEELWKDIQGYEGMYQVSNFGMIRGLDRVRNGKNNKTHRVNGVILKPGIAPNGYLFVILKKPKTKNWIISIHKLVALVFIPNPQNKPQINHKDGNKSNNNYTNLEWCTSKENQNHSSINGFTAFGEKNGNNKLKETAVIEIRKYWECKTLSVMELAKKYNVDRTTIYNIVKNKQWNNKNLDCNKIYSPAYSGAM
jgi:hypothetical protein